MSSKGIGKLKFKGDASKPKKKRPRDARDEAEAGMPSSSSSAAATASNAAFGDEDADADEIPEPIQGTGRITTSGTTVAGHFTKFMDELRPGDAILITHPTTLQTEMKVVRMVLSNMSIGISSGFSSDLISTTSFK